MPRNTMVLFSYGKSHQTCFEKIPFWLVSCQLTKSIFIPKAAWSKNIGGWLRIPTASKRLLHLPEAPQLHLLVAAILTSSASFVLQKNTSEAFWKRNLLYTLISYLNTSSKLFVAIIIGHEWIVLTNSGSRSWSATSKSCAFQFRWDVTC